MALLRPIAPPETRPSGAVESRLRRCTFRRLVQVEPLRSERSYEIECLYPERRLPIPLGDVASAAPVCNACTAAHVFRPDED